MISTSDTLFHGNSSRIPLESKIAIMSLNISADMTLSTNALTNPEIMQNSLSFIAQNQMLRSTLNDTAGMGAPSCRPLIACVRTFNGIGLLYSCFLGLVMGATTIILSPFEYFINPQLFFDAIHKYRIKDTVVTYPMMEWALATMESGDYRSFSLNNLDNLMIMSESRPRIDLRKFL
jgi:hypothetical protein